MSTGTLPCASTGWARCACTACGTAPLTTAQTATTATNATNATNATQLGGVPASGYLRPVGDLVYYVAPAGMVREDTNLTVLADRGIANITSATAGNHLVSLPLPVPGSIFGTSLRVSSVRICYRVSNAATFITNTILLEVNDNGANQLAFDVTDRTGHPELAPVAATPSGPGDLQANET